MPGRPFLDGPASPKKMAPRPSLPKPGPRDPDVTALAEAETLFWSGRTREVGQLIEAVDVTNVSASVATRLATRMGWRSSSWAT